MSRAVTSMASVLMVFAAIQSVRAADDEPTEILARAIKAHGGEEFLMKHKAGRSQIKGKITLPGLGEAEFTQTVAYMLPNKFRDQLELSISGQTVKIETIMNGDAISISGMGSDVEITDNIRKAIKEAVGMMEAVRLVPLVKDKAYELSLFGEAKVDEKPALGVRVSGKGKKEMTLFFDKKTNLLAKIEHRTIEADSGNEVAEERIVLEYNKDKNGIPVPKKVLVKHDGKTFLEAETGDFTYLEKIDDSEFKK
jgi:hypothetical protein